LGHCHCQEGYAPPDCRNPGSGGSVDSGPAAETDEVSILAENFGQFLPFLFLYLFLYFYFLRLPGPGWGVNPGSFEFVYFLIPSLYR
jgi:hypothetical protein